MFKRINLYGGPGAGKTSMASFLTHQLKTRHFVVEQVNEFAKTLAYQKYQITEFDQPWIFVNQMHSEEIYLKNGANLTVTDAPLYLMLAYIKRDCGWLYDCMEPIAAKFEEKYPSLHVYIERPGEETYQQRGRYEDYARACEVDTLVRDVLDRHLGVNGYHILQFDSGRTILDLVLGLL